MSTSYQHVTPGLKARFVAAILTEDTLPLDDLVSFVGDLANSPPTDDDLDRVERVGQKALREVSERVFSGHIPLDVSLVDFIEETIATIREEFQIR